jgi:hypothetical protein
MTELPSEAEFKAYEKVRVRGRWNMFSKEATRATHLDDERYLEVLKNYDALVLAYPGVRKEN